MIYNDKFIFVHVPKTGGTSVRRALESKYAVKRSAHFHCALRNAPMPTANRFAFGFIRNPWERMVSYYRFMCQKPAGPNDHKVYKRQAVIDMGFKDWVLHAKWGAEIKKAVGDFEGATTTHHVSQMWWLRGCDFIGRFEWLQQDFDAVMERLQLPKILLPHYQKTHGGAWQDEYDGELVDFVRWKFAEDIKAGGYAFDGAEESARLAG
jgi:hypothetical protein